jgi:hypothetical protein
MFSKFSSAKQMKCREVNMCLQHTLSHDNLVELLAMPTRRPQLSRLLDMVRCRNSQGIAKSRQRLLEAFIKVQRFFRAVEIVPLLQVGVPDCKEVCYYSPGQFDEMQCTNVWGKEIGRGVFVGGEGSL